MSRMPTDEELRNTFDQATDKAYQAFFISRQEAKLFGVRAVKEAVLAAQPVPVIPEGWELVNVEWDVIIGRYEAMIGGKKDGGRYRFGDHPSDPFAALQAAIDQIGGET